MEGEVFDIYYMKFSKNKNTVIKMGEIEREVELERERLTPGLRYSSVVWSLLQKSLEKAVVRSWVLSFAQDILKRRRKMGRKKKEGNEKEESKGEGEV